MIMTKFNPKGADLLINAIIKIQDEDTCKEFLADLLSIQEYETMSQRMDVAKCLSEKKSYQEIADTTGASTATISRVNRCYVYGDGGYKKILTLIKD